MTSPETTPPNAPPKDVIRVLVADDHQVVREGLVAMIGREPDMAVVAEAGNGRQAIEQFVRHRPDVSLMDLRMPEIDGVEAITAIRDKNADARIVVLTTFDGDEDIYRGLRAGAKAYLLKDAPGEELLECIRSVHRGKMCVPPTIAAKLAGRLSGSELTARELDVLKLMAEGRSNREIAHSLTITEGTVKAHVNNILNKMNVSGRTEAVTLAIKRGIVHL
jgi:two-component system NarL family response regulator